MNNAPKSKVTSMYRIVKARPGHQFAGLYAVEKVWFKDGVAIKKQIAHEWDLRIISESILARLGGQDAYESYKTEHNDIDLGLSPDTADDEARTPEDLTLTKRKLVKELKLKPEPDGNK